MPAKVPGPVALNNLLRVLASGRVCTRSMAAQVQALSVAHDKANKVFYVEMGNDKAVLTYEEAGPGVLDLQHTEVPGVFRGKGVAALLAREAFEFVAKSDLKTKVSCSYLVEYLKKNPQYSSHVVD